jgi:hypothetical protein
MVASIIVFVIGVARQQLENPLKNPARHSRSGVRRCFAFPLATSWKSILLERLSMRLDISSENAHRLVQ